MILKRSAIEIMTLAIYFRLLVVAYPVRLLIVENYDCFEFIRLDTQGSMSIIRIATF